MGLLLPPLRPGIELPAGIAMSFVVETRMAWNDALVSEWGSLDPLHEECEPRDSALEALVFLCDWIGCQAVLCEVPFVGKIKTGRGYGEYTLFRHPDNKPIQYRIVESKKSEKDSDEVPLMKQPARVFRLEEE